MERDTQTEAPRERHKGTEIQRWETVRKEDRTAAIRDTGPGTESQTVTLS